MEKTADGGHRAAPPILIAADPTDLAEVQPALEHMYRIILNTYTQSDKNEANKVNEAMSDQLEYNNEEEGEEGEDEGEGDLVGCPRRQLLV